MIYVCADTHSRNIEFESQPDDVFIHCGDYEQGEIKTAAHKILVRGNHDILPITEFDAVCDGYLLNHIWFTHEPAFTLPLGAHWNVHGHIHNIDMNDLGYVKKPWHISLPPNEIHKLDELLWKAKNE